MESRWRARPRRVERGLQDPKLRMGNSEWGEAPRPPKSWTAKLRPLVDPRLPLRPRGTLRPRVLSL